MCVHAQSCLTLLLPHGLQPIDLLCPWTLPGKNTRVGYHFLLKGLILTQGLNPSLLCILPWQADCLALNRLESPEK